MRFRLFALLLILLVPTCAMARKAKGTEKTKAEPANPTAGEDDSSRLKGETFQAFELRGIGPALMSGRIADIAIHPQDQSTWYVAAGSGGVWKTDNAGTTWTSIFDGQGSYSIGCISLDPTRPEVVWVGTGENVGGRHVGYGDGVYRSLDGGKSWRNMGLGDSEHIGNIVIHPEHSQIVYVAAQGPLWSAGGERGLYKSSDFGETWEKILGGGEHTGVNEVRMDPRDPRILYASTHQRRRTVAALLNGGPESGIHKSLDGGKTWRQLETGIPKEDKGKIGLAISPQNPDVVYATIELGQRKGGFFRSTDAGGSWQKRNDYVSGGTGPHYYQEIFASPHQFDRVYQMDAAFRLTEDGGNTFTRVKEEAKHGDSHAMAFDPNDPNYLLNGSDGGLYESWDLGQNWKFVSNLPITQFYKVAVDNDLPFYNVYGGTQDNNTQGGPSRTLSRNGILSSDWFITLFADGHQPAVDPQNPDIVYSEWQGGNLVRYDRKNGEIVHIQPQPEQGEAAERWNWDAPILISPHDPARLYFASQRLWRSDDRGDSWRPISGDLSRGQDRLTMPMMGRVWSPEANWDLFAMSNFGTITSLAESPRQEGLLYAGTDDGLIQVSHNGGQDWRKIDHIAGIPPHSFVNDIKADLHDADTVYAVFDNSKTGDFQPYVVKSHDRGETWTSIVGDLPDRHIVWRLVQDHVRPDLLFLGTEFGLFFTLDGGSQWIPLSADAPTIPFRDLTIQKRENDLVAASFGRGFFILDDYSPLRQISETALEQEAHLFTPKDALWYIPKRPLGRAERATQGGDFFIAPNPPFGAIFTYYLRDSLESRKAQRQDKDKAIKKDGADTPYPGWQALRDEARELEPSIGLNVRNAAGDLVRRISGPGEAGFHRVAWDLRLPAPNAWRPERGVERDGGGDPPEGPLAAPGTYRVELAKRVDGAFEILAETQSFQVIPLSTAALPGMAPAEVAAFLSHMAELRRTLSATDAIVEMSEKRIDAIAQTLLRSNAGNELFATTEALRQRLLSLKEGLNGNSEKSRLSEPIPPSVSDRLELAAFGTSFSTYGPTKTHRRQSVIAEEELIALRKALDSLLHDLDRLQSQLEEAKVPWTPGRGIRP